MEHCGSGWFMQEDIDFDQELQIRPWDALKDEPSAANIVITPRNVFKDSDSPI